MHVSCPKCATKYNLPDAMFKPGAKAKCTVCQHVFPLTPPEPEEDDILGDLDFGDGAQGQDGTADGGFGLPDDDDFGLPDDLADDLPASEPAAKPKASGRGRGKDVDVEVDVDLGDDDDGGLGFDLDDGGSKKKGKKGRKGAKGGSGGKGKLIGLILGGVLLVAVCAGAGLYFLAPQYLPFLAPKDAATEGEGGTVDVMATDQIKDIELRGVRQYILPNEKAGQILVVEGSAFNNFQIPKELIKVSVTLFDASGVSIVSKTVLCGNTASLFQLKTLGEEDLESVLQNKVGVLTANTNVPPGGEVPFMVVLYNPPDTMRQFAVKVVAAQDPPKK
ncbi:MAG: DUF3426 domain-containing protein [Desulfovibrionaceae bacterium]